MAGVRSGDDAAFGRIYDRYAGSLLAFCHHTLGSREEAEDALQDVFVAAHKQMRFASSPQQLKPWLYAVARNRCLSVLRARRETVALDDVIERAGSADVSREAQRREDIRELLADVAALPHAQREALILAEVGALSHDEIAVALGVRTDKVRALVFRARRSLMVSRAARDTTCRDIQEQLAVLRGAALRRGAIRRHVGRCSACAAFENEVQRQRSALAWALPVLPAAALKPTILAAVHAGVTGGAVAAGGGISAVAVTTGSSTAVGGGLTGLASSALMTKVLAVGAVASIAVGASTAVVRLEHTDEHVGTTASATRATTPPSPTRKAAPISAISLIHVPSGQSASESGSADAHAEGRPGIHRRASGRPGRGVTGETPVRVPNGKTEATGIRGSTAPGFEPSPQTSATPEKAEPGSSSPGGDTVRSGSSAAGSDGAKSGSSAGPNGAEQESTAAESNSAKPASPPGQSHSAAPATPPGQSSNAKPESPPGQSHSAKPATPPGQSSNATQEASAAEPGNAKESPPGQSNAAKQESPPGQSTNAKPESPPGQSSNADQASPPGQANGAKPDSPPGQSN
jgi:RNA polymerase sigma factor (sigma-70 family)